MDAWCDPTQPVWTTAGRLHRALKSILRGNPWWSGVHGASSHPWIPGEVHYTLVRRSQRFQQHVPPQKLPAMADVISVADIYAITVYSCELQKLLSAMHGRAAKPSRPLAAYDRAVA